MIATTSQADLITPWHEWWANIERDRQRKRERGGGGQRKRNTFGGRGGVGGVRDAEEEGKETRPRSPPCANHAATSLKMRKPPISIRTQHPYRRHQPRHPSHSHRYNHAPKRRKPPCIPPHPSPPSLSTPAAACIDAAMCREGEAKGDYEREARDQCAAHQDADVVEVREIGSSCCRC